MLPRIRLTSARSFLVSDNINYSRVSVLRESLLQLLMSSMARVALDNELSLVSRGSKAAIVLLLLPKVRIAVNHPSTSRASCILVSFVK